MSLREPTDGECPIRATAFDPAVQQDHRRPGTGLDDRGGDTVDHEPSMLERQASQEALPAHPLGPRLRHLNHLVESGSGSTLRSLRGLCFGRIMQMAG